MEYLNEDNFKELDKFITECEEKGAAIGDLQSVSDSIDGMFMIPVRASTPYVGVLRGNGAETDLEYYQQCLDMGVALENDEYLHYQELLAEYEASQKDSK